MDENQMKREIADLADAHKEEFEAVSAHIFENPELAFHETEAQKTLCGLLIQYLCEKHEGPVLAVDADAITPVETVAGRVLFAMAVYIGKTRLIDNFITDAVA